MKKTPSTKRFGVKMPFGQVEEAARASAGAAPVTPKGGPSVLRMALSSLVLVVGLIAGGGYVHFLQMQEMALKTEQALGSAVAAKASGQLAARLQSYAELVEAMATQPRLADAVLAGEQRVLNEYQVMLETMLPGVLRVRYLPLGIEAVDERDTPALGYACLDLARRGEAGERPPLEVHVLGTEHQHIDLLRPISNTQGVVATLLVSLDVQHLKAWLKPLLPAEAYAEVRQSGSLVLIAQGPPALKNQRADFNTPVKGSSWSLHYWPARSDAGLEAQAMGMLTVIGGALFGVLVVVLGFTLLLRRTLQKDLVTLVRLVVETSQGKSFAERPRLLEFRHVVAAFERRRQKVDEESVAAGQGALQQGLEPECEMEEDELSSALFLKDALVVDEPAPIDRPAPLDMPSDEALPEPEPGDEEGPASNGLSAEEVAKALQDIEKDA